jgi:carbonic anhydrase
MDRFKDLFDYNQQWAAERVAADPQYFSKLCAIQTPEFLWIGCSDSRVPANQITGLQPGEVFVHRNIANVVPTDDMNSSAVIQYAVDVLKVKHIIICGHYGCGGVQAALGDSLEPPLEDWVSHLREVRDSHTDDLAQLPDDEARWNRLCELNVVAQAKNTARLGPVQNAWAAGQSLAVHAWIYDLHDGLLKELGLTLES